MPSFRTKRWNDPAEPGDGLRVLICRYWPRGVRKADKTWDLWIPDLGPSRALHAAFYGKNGHAPLGWTEYRRRYLAEIETRREKLEELRSRIRGEAAVTLLCSSACVDERHCHRSLLRRLLEEGEA